MNNLTSTELQEYITQGYRVLALDSQILSSISLCEMKTNLRFIGNYELAGEDKADYLDRGDLMHFGLKVYYTLKKRTDKYNWQDRVDISVGLMRKHAIGLSIDVLESEEYIDVFKEYCDFHKMESWIPVKVEQPFTVLLFVDHDLKLVVLYEGVIDLIIENVRETFKIVDHKGTKRRYSPLELTFQFVGYCWALGYNEIIAQQIGFQKTLSADKKFLRYTFSFPKATVEEWYFNACSFIKRWVRSVDDNNFLMSINGTACNAYNRLCPYYKNYCKATPDSREWLLETRYHKVEPWSPWTRDTEIDKLLEEMIK